MTDEMEIASLYQKLISAWNHRDAHAYAAQLAEDSNLIGFDGSMMNGRAEIESVIGQIFADHVTAAYYAKIREVRFLTPDAALLRAVVGMVPPGQTDINPAVNAIQSMVAVRKNGQWQIALFQNTPAQFHGRPELSEALTQELRALLPT